MILSVSRRTDIPACYSEWFFHRLKEQSVLVRNPVNPHQVSRINLSPEVIDGIVFWTKNPVPMFPRLKELEKYYFYFQFTLTAYGPEVERNLPSKNRVLIPAFQQLSNMIGRERVVWRYDPIFFGETYTMEYHCRYFEVLASKLAPYTEKCTISFLDFYQNTERSMKPLHIRPAAVKQQIELVERFARIAQKYGLYLDTCAESCDFTRFGVSHASCIDKERFERIGQYRLDIEKDKNQRDGCGCAASIDIGAYDTCKNGCLYCYADHRDAGMDRTPKEHDPKSPLLSGKITEKDRIMDRSVRSSIDGQMTLFG